MAEDVQATVEEPKVNPYEIKMADGKVVYTSSQEEFGDCFYAVLSLLSWSKTFQVKPDFALTFSTITDEEHIELLSNVRQWANEKNASGQMFDAYLTKVNLAYYMTTIQLQTSMVNLREKGVPERLEYLSKMPEQALNLYGMYNYIFNEIVRLALVEPLNLKN